MAQKRGLKPGKYMIDKMREAGFVAREAPSSKKYYVNDQGFQIVVDYKVRSIRLVNPLGYTIAERKVLYPTQLLTLSRLSRDQADQAYSLIFEE